MNTRSSRLITLCLAAVIGGSAACVPPPAGRPSPTPAPSPAPTASPAATPSGPTPSPSFVRPTATPRPTFMAYLVRTGDTLSSVARAFGTTPTSLAYWNRDRYPSLDPDSPGYDPNDIRVGWTLLLLPNDVVDPEDIPPLPATPNPTTPAPVTPRPPTASPAAKSTVVSNGPRGSGQVALTLDMGGRLDPALDIMRWLVANRVPATIFPTGKSASTTAIGREVLAIIRAHPELFDLGNHSWNHPDFRKLTAAEILRELDDTERVLRDGTGVSSRPWFRPPYGGRDADVDRAVGAAGWRYSVMWDVDTIDWRHVDDGGPTAAQMRAKVRDKAQGGSIVLMHLGGWHTLEALPGILADLEANDLRPVTLDEMFGE